MDIVNINSVPEDEWHSPNKRYQLFRKSLSLALGGRKDIGEWGGGHPFDLELARLPSGKSNFPLHSHSCQAELYIIIAGTGIFHNLASEREIGAGDVLHCQPGEAHRLDNTGDCDLVYYVIADNPKVDVCSYPETGKMLIKPEKKCFYPKEADYFECDD